MTRDDLVLSDGDGALFVPSRQAEKIFTLAETIRDTERRQAEQIRAGVSLRSQVRFSDYIAKRGQTPALSFREHLRAVGGAIEEMTSSSSRPWICSALATAAAVQCTPCCGASGRLRTRTVVLATERRARNGRGRTRPPLTQRL